MMLENWYRISNDTTNFREKAYLKSFKRCYTDLNDLFSKEFLERTNADDALISPLKKYFELKQPSFFLDKLQYMNISLKGSKLILPKVDRMLGACGITPMSPLFDRRLIDLSFRIPCTLKLRNANEKLIMKMAMRGCLPEAIIDRPKQGMRVPVLQWFANEMKDYIHELLDPLKIKSAGIFNENCIRQLLNYDYSERHSRFGMALWMIMTFEIWRKQTKAYFN